MRKLILIFLVFPLYIFAQDTTETSLVNWIDIQKVETLFKTTPKPILIDVYTDWCGWCKYMMKTTYSNANIAAYINTNFYPVRFDAETSDSVIFNGKVYKKSGKTNQLGNELLNGQLSYPTTVFFSRNGQKFNIPGYLKPNQFEPFLIYFAEDLYNFVSLEDFNTQYMFTYPKNYTEDISKISDEKKPDTLGKPKWTNFDEIKVLKKNDQSKKFILFTSVPWCYSCKIMKKMTFSNSIISEIINKKYYLIDFDASTEKTIIVDTNKFVSMGKGQPNQLAAAIFQGNYAFPAIVILDNNFSILNIITGYITANQIEPILNYFSSDIWKTEKYEDYLKNFQAKIK